MTERVEGHLVVPSDAPPSVPAHLVEDFTPALVDVGAHTLCPGCGEPIALRATLEAIAELDAVRRTIAVFGIGCYTAFSNNLDVEVLQALHGRAPSLATGVKRAKPGTVVFTMQGDGDMVNEGLQEVLHAAARGERITCIMLNNGVFGETGGHMTSTTVLGQRTKNTLDGRDAEAHGYPIMLSNLIAQLEGAAYVARGAVNNAGNVARTKKMLLRAFESQIAGEGFSFVEILTMCPTGWFVETQEAPGYLSEHLGAVHAVGVLKDRSLG
jgi:2-oxoglutarate ferredoxin oxidoreductase subunit beta